MQNKTIGLLGGIGWASTLEYYRLINEMLVARIGPAHSARIMLVSMDQADFVAHAAQPDSHAIEQFLVGEGQRLRDMGADFFLLCANGAHRFAPAVVPRIGLPFISIVEETAKRVQQSGIRKVGLLGVKQTMAGSFYHQALAQLDIATVTPEAADQDILHDIIYTELVQNIFTDASRKFFLAIIEKLRRQGVQGVILGCTEIPLLIQQGDVDLPLFNTTAIHCEAAVAFAIED
ncbi:MULTISPECIES: amino acid racemase [unclassified Janthinobacterium]|uniref:aspartate/glutamate racemase family protein n=1 Tax=unclassified Janthinobacterium TaxID=2610881 RepID=UPI0025AFB454|nr:MULTISPECIES: amino acid racemase [unclassified Janthinobacterium]MDN2714376.1 amino acid racemase [Janthinobacterium sp. SUN120]MDO8040108.1 amino acid racemase [Janthinobacterium sp. SUN137]